MVWLIIGLLVLVFAAVLFYMSASAKRENELEFAKGLGVAAGAGVVIALILGSISTVYTQDEGEANVIKSVSGEVVGTDITPGWSVKTPWSKTISYSTRNNKVDITVPFRDRDGGSGNMTLYVMYNLTPTDENLRSLYSSYKSEQEVHELLIKRDVQGVLNKIPAKYSTAEIMTNRGVLEEEMQAVLSEEWAKAGFSAVKITIENDGYPETVTKEYENLIAERVKAERSKAETATAEESAKRQIVEAEAKAKANKIIADSLKSDEAMRQAELETLKSIGEKGNLIITDGDSGTLLNVDTKKSE